MAVRCCSEAGWICPFQTIELSISSVLSGSCDIEGGGGCSQTISGSMSASKTWSRTRNLNDFSLAPPADKFSKFAASGGLCTVEPSILGWGDGEIESDYPAGGLAIVSTTGTTATLTVTCTEEGYHGYTETANGGYRVAISISFGTNAAGDGRAWFIHVDLHVDGDLFDPGAYMSASFDFPEIPATEIMGAHTGTLDQEFNGGCQLSTVTATVTFS